MQFWKYGQFCENQQICKTFVSFMQAMDRFGWLEIQGSTSMPNVLENFQAALDHPSPPVFRDKILQIFWDALTIAVRKENLQYKFFIHVGI